MTEPALHIETDGHDLTLWADRPDHAFGDEALVRECDVDPRVWALLTSHPAVTA